MFQTLNFNYLGIWSALKLSSETRRQAHYECTGWFRRKSQYFWKWYCRSLWEQISYEHFRIFIEIDLFESTHTKALSVAIIKQITYC